MTPQEQLNVQCQEIIKGVQNLITEADQKIRTADARSKTAEEMLSRIKEAATKEISKAFDLGVQEGKKIANATSDSGGGTEKEKEEIVKLVLNN